jgi:hypothetical protein
MSELLKCFHCEWSGSKYHLLIGPNGIKCPKCKKHIPQDAEGWISIKDNGLPEEGGFYSVKTTLYGESKVPFSFDLSGKGLWVVPDASIITHWKYK